MIKHKLKLNQSKTEFMVALSPHNLKKYGLPENLIVGGVNIEPVMSVRNLGTYFDMSMSMKQHVDAVCRDCNYHLRRTRSIRSYITKQFISHRTGCFKLRLLQRSAAGPTRTSINTSPEDTQQGSTPGCSHSCLFTHHASTRTTALVDCQTTHCV